MLWSSLGKVSLGFQLFDCILGRFGSVFKGKNMQTNELVAIKMIEFHTSLQKLDGIVNEVNLLKETIQCPYVVE